MRRTGAARSGRLLLLFLVVLCIAAACTRVSEPADRRLASPAPGQSGGSPPPPRPVAPWLRRVQVVSIWPLANDQNLRFGIDVPGFFTWWDEDNVRTLHRNGKRAVVVVEGLAAEPELLEEYPELRNAASLDVFGNEARAEWYQALQKRPDPVIVLSILSPVFQEYLYAQGRRAVDIGADAFYIDEIQTSALLIDREQYASGFSPLEMSTYDRHLAGLGFDSPAAYLLSLEGAEWLTGDVVSLLERADADRLSVGQLLRSSDPPLFLAQVALLQDYKRFQEDTAFRIMTGIIQKVRDYAAQQGRTLSIGANLAGMGGRTWWSAMMSMGWASHLDFIVFENDLTQSGSSSFLVSLPEGSFAPAYRLGRALTPGLVAAFPSVALAPALYSLDDYATYLSIMYAEAFAFEGNWALGWWTEEMEWPRDELAPHSLAALTRFVTRWHRLYEGARAPNRVAVLYGNEGVLADPQRHESYFGLGQALAELNVQYDVLYAGDGRFGDSMPAQEVLERYETVFAPTANELTERQVTALQSYLAEGGKLVAVDPVSSQLAGTPGLQTIDDAGLMYRSGDRERALGVLAELVDDTGRIVLSTSGEGVVATSFLREGLPGLVVHFVNRRYTLLSDRVEPARSIEVRLEPPPSFDESWRLWLLAPGAAPQEAPFTTESGTIRFTLPTLDVYAVAVFSAERPA